MHSDHDIIGSRVRTDQTEGLGLFDTARSAQASSPPPRRPVPRTPVASSPDGPSDRRVAIERLKELIEPQLLALAKSRVDVGNAPGVTADDVHELANQYPHVALLGEKQRAFSWVGPWLRGLAGRGVLVEYRVAGMSVKRRSRRDDAHGNDQIVYLHPDDFRAGGRAA